MSQSHDAAPKAPQKLQFDDTNLPDEDLDPEALEEAPKAPALPASAGDDVPEWAIVPGNLKVPKGRQVVFLRFVPSMTDTPAKGERQCICWSLSDGEEKMANDRTGGSSARAPAEFTKQMIRSIDGSVVDWGKAKGPGSIDEFYREIGPKCRNLLMRIYTQLHLATEDEARDFFESCVAVRTATLDTTKTGGPPIPTSPRRCWPRSPVLPAIPLTTSSSGTRFRRCSSQKRCRGCDFVGTSSWLGTVGSRCFSGPTSTGARCARTLTPWLSSSEKRTRRRRKR